MPKKYYEDVKYIRPKGKSRLGRIWTIIFVVLCMALMIFLSNILSNFLAMRGLNMSIFGGNTNSVIAETKMYAVSMGEYEDKTEATNQANSLSLFGAGGYVWEENGKYFVLGAVYESKSDAESVINGINSGVYKASLKEILFSKLEMDKTHFNTFYEYYNGLKTVYKSVYDIVCKIDKGEYSYIQAGTMLNDLKSEVCTIRTKIEDYLSHELVDSLLLTKYAYVKIESSLDGLTNKVITNDYISYAIRYETIYVVEIWHNLNVSIATLV